MSGSGHARVRRATGSFGLMDFPRDPNDEYETPPKAIESLLRLEPLTGGCWDSSCGRGNIVKTLRRCLPPHDAVVGTDIAFGQDFLAATAMPAACNNILINPPFSASDGHVRHALELLPDDGKVAALLRFNWITARRRADLLTRLRTIVIVGRLKMLPPGVPDLGHGGTVDFAWFVFGKAANGANGTRIVRA